MHAGNHSLHPLWGGRKEEGEGPSITLVAASNAPPCTYTPTSIRIRPHTNGQGGHMRNLRIFRIRTLDTYRVTHMLRNLGWVYLDLEIHTCYQKPRHNWADCWTPNSSQSILGLRADQSLCILRRFVFRHFGGIFWKFDLKGRYVDGFFMAQCTTHGMF